ncbi:hypothetical protein [Aurantibacter aestuarii]|uniref:Uncharacterized protein n=1 Tax=Aurantibacter aestuarii TaxID=1266046 RepID=A0A2T1NFW7_9FLAO|nr:hypothetical protein [Aurantibacter aestuarii]PSG91645.1 hypothetical protein C7H52_00595 [Aurantibacter aestuarii]
MRVTNFPDWTFDFDGTRMGWYNINATRITGNLIGIDGTDEYIGLEKIISDIVDFELIQNRTYSYWNKVFAEIFKSNGLIFHNNLELETPNDHFKSWVIKLYNVELYFKCSEPEIRLIQNEKRLYSKKWTEFNGTEFFKLLNQIRNQLPTKYKKNY